jgi:hypothetical protein
MKVLLVEPKSSTTYPPMGLMKFARYHKLRGDDVTYVVGKNKNAHDQFWDKIYITSVFTYDFKNLLDTINYYSENLYNFENMTVGGIAATLLAEKLKKLTGIDIHCGLQDSIDPFLENLARTNLKYNYLLDCSPTIDNLPPDYEIVNENAKYSKITDNAFFLYSTKGCPNNCSFCAVKKLEPKYVSYIPIKKRISILREEIGDRAGLLFLDNNIAASDSFFKIIDEIIDCGYGCGEKMCYEKNGRKIYKHRFVDFNQGVDLRLLNREKMEALSKTAINPLRLAFDNVDLANEYEEKAKLAIECGITKLSNYMLYNYKDSPEDLYARMEVNTDIIKKYGNENVKIFSFPMRYSPINKTDRAYIGKKWHKRQIRAIQLILNATHGIVSHSLREYKEGKGFFYRAFGANESEFIENLWMPFHYLINRDYYELEHSNIKEWRQAFKALSAHEAQEVMNWIKDGINKEHLNTQSGKLKEFMTHYDNEHTQVIK